MTAPAEFNNLARPPPQKSNDLDHEKAIVNLIESVGYRHDKWRVFSDFLEMAATSISNAVDLRARDKREERYLQIVKAYDKDELAKFPQMLGHLVEALEREPDDILGRVFHDLELHNKYAGQFFTPMPICRLMAEMTVGATDHAQLLNARGYISALEPAAGSGAMIIAMAQALKDSGVNYQNQLHVTAVDVDAKCVHMAYLQLSLLHIPAVIVHGNSLTLEEFDHWYTPAHILGGWTWRLKHDRARDADQILAEDNGQVLAPAFAAATDATRSSPTHEPQPETQEQPAGPATQLTLF